jgi:ligand-binding SRPBCC domain-containing protein
VTTRIELTTTIRAPVPVCFDLARSVDVHVRSFAHTGERAVGGRTAGPLGLGEEVTWRGRHFGVVHEHTSRITAFDPPRYFRDSMVRGRFRSFEHDHWFEPGPDGTVMRDLLVFSSPCGVLGRLVDRLVLRRYLTRLLERRNAALRSEAEASLRSERASAGS